MQGEHTALLCADGDDNDGDLLVDCEDPDCHAFERCHGEPLVVEWERPDAAIGRAWVGGLPQTVLGGRIEAAGADAGQADGPSAEGGRPDAPSSDAASPDEPLDPDDTCAQDSCRVRHLRITRIEVTVPKQTSYTNDNLTDCLDPDDRCLRPSASRPFQLCGCSPDPWVRVSVGGNEAGRTEPRINTEHAQWATSIDLVLQPDDEIRFEVLDRDTFEDQPILSFPVHGDALADLPATISCSREFTTDEGRQAFPVSADVEAVL